ncbi:MAG: SigB/SigF/SigG family RNA polymerase sigma factor [Solirubrobacteraceae bacterium]
MTTATASAVLNTTSAALDLPLPIRPGAGARARNDDLFLRWQQHGDRRARDELVERFLPLARKLARRYSGAREPFDDLLQVASLGLVKAIDRYDTGRGTAFSSFAVPTILGELKRYFRDLGWAVHVPRGAQERAVKVEETRQQLAARHNRAPTVAELAEYLEFDIEDVLEALETSRAHHAASLDAPYDDGDGESGTMVESFGHEDPNLRLADERMTVITAARGLPQREREVLALRFVHDLTQTQIAERVGVSQMQVSRILRRALAQLAELADDDPDGG